LGTKPQDASGCGGQSFAQDTGVVLASGAVVPISQVKVGDQVEATDPATGQTSAQTVTAVWVNHDTDLMDVTVTAGGGTSTIHATQHHPFWDVTRHAWIDANQLQVGDQLTTTDGAGDMWDLTVANTHDFYVTATAPNTTAATATARPDDTTTTTRNHTTSSIHTYYVMAGTTPILVHNANCPTSVNDAGRFGDLKGVVGDGLTPHHMPQDALGFAPRQEGGAIVMTHADHLLTRTYGPLGAATKLAEAGLPFRTVLARDIWDMRRIGQIQYGDPSYFNTGIQRLLAYYRKTGQLP
jgi:hypothetical protein